MLAVLSSAITSVTTATMSAGCVIPVPLVLEESDAGPSSPPVILSASPTEFAFPGPMTLDDGDQRRLGLSISDRDFEDSLHVRIFVDYGLPDQATFASECAVPGPSETAVRVADCSVARLCDQVPAADQTHFLEVMVSDRPFLLSSDPRIAGQPPFREVPDEAAVSFRSWQLRCTKEAPQ